MITFCIFDNGVPSRTILREIEEIKVGLRDKEIQAKITGEDPAESDPSKPLKVRDVFPKNVIQLQYPHRRAPQTNLSTKD